MADWLNGATRDPIPGVSGAGWENESKPAWKLLLHTTEGGSYAGARASYVRNKFAPHVTIGPDDHGQVRAWQHLSFGHRATTLSDRPGGIRPNREHVLQAEIVGFCDPKWKNHPLYIHNWSEDYKRGVAGWLRAMRAAKPIPARSTVRWVDYPKSYGLNASQRLSANEFDDYEGILGHQHAPESTHGDPGDLSAFVRTYLEKREEPELTPQEHEWLKKIANNLLRIGSLRNKGEYHAAGYYAAHSDRNAYDAKKLAQQHLPRIVASLQTLYGKHDAFAEDVRQRLAAIEHRLDRLGKPGPSPQEEEEKASR